LKGRCCKVLQDSLLFGNVLINLSKRLTKKKDLIHSASGKAVRMWGTSYKIFWNISRKYLLLTEHSGGKIKNILNLIWYKNILDINEIQLQNHNLLKKQHFKNLFHIIASAIFFKNFDSALPNHCRMQTSPSMHKSRKDAASFNFNIQSPWSLHWSFITVHMQGPYTHHIKSNPFIAGNTQFNSLLCEQTKVLLLSSHMPLNNNAADKSHHSHDQILKLYKQTNLLFLMYQIIMLYHVSSIFYIILIQY